MCGRGFFHSRLSSLRILRAQILNHHVQAIARLIFNSDFSLMIENYVGTRDLPGSGSLKQTYSLQKLKMVFHVDILKLYFTRLYGFCLYKSGLTSVIAQLITRLQ